MKRYLFYIDSSRGLERVFYQPYGWSQAGYELVRNETYGGVFRKYVVSSLEFIKDGKVILKDLKESEGTECDADFIVKEFDPATHYYTECFSGKIDFSTYRRKLTKIQVNILDTSFDQKVKNREEIPASLVKLVDQDGAAIAPFTSEGVDINMPQRLDYLRDNLQPFYGETYATSHSIPLQLETAQTANSHTVVDTSAYTTADGSIYLGASDEVLLVAGYIAATVNFAGTIDVELRVYSGSGLERYTSLLSDTNAGGDYALYIDPIAENMTVNTGEWLNLVVILNKTSGTGVTGDYIADITISTRKDLVASTTAQAFWYYEAFCRILQSITGVANPIYSDFFGRTDSEPDTYGSDGVGSLGVVTSGKQLRNFLLSDIPPYCSLKELFTALRAVYNIGMGSESGKVRIEPLNYFFGSFIIQNSTPTQLTFGNCKDIEESVNTDLIYNKIVIGFDKSETVESLDGLYEFNTQITYGDTIKSVKQELSLVSPYRADDAGVMLARSKPKATYPEEDVNTDKDNFLLKVVRMGVGHNPKLEEDEAFTSITGTVNNEHVYNVEYSPARSLRRFGSVIRGFLELYSTSSLIYTKQEKNSRLVSEKSGEDPITERADVLVSGLTAPLWEATRYTFETPITQTEILVIDQGTTGGVSNKYGVVKFRQNEDDLWKYGWILSMKVKDDGIKSVARFELLKVDATLALTLEPS